MSTQETAPTPCPRCAAYGWSHCAWCKRGHRVVNPWHDPKNPESPRQFDIGGLDGEPFWNVRFLRNVTPGQTPSVLVLDDAGKVLTQCVTRAGAIRELFGADAQAVPS